MSGSPARLALDVQHHGPARTYCVVSVISCQITQKQWPQMDEIWATVSRVNIFVLPSTLKATQLTLAMTDEEFC